MDDSEAQFALTAWSLRLWAELAGELPADCEDDPCGTLWLAAGEAEMERVRAKAGYYRARGVAAEVLDAVQLAAAEPRLRGGLAGALRVPGDRVIYPPNAVRYLLARAADHGAEIWERFFVSRVAGGVVEGHGERIPAPLVINAAGAAAPDLTPGLPIVPRKGHLLITDRHPGFCRHQLVELGYLDSAHGRRRDETAAPAAAATPASVAFNVQPRATGQVLIGSQPPPRAADDRARPRLPAAPRRRRGAARLDRLPSRDSRQPAAHRTVAGGPGAVDRRRPRGPRHHHQPGHRPPARRPGQRAATGDRCRPFRTGSLAADGARGLARARRRRGCTEPRRRRRRRRAGGAMTPAPGPAPAIALRVDGHSITVAPGTTVAAALWRAGISSCRRSLSGEWRGPVCGMGICFECRVTVDGVPHQRACLLPCAQGMVVETGPASAPPRAAAAAALGEEAPGLAPATAVSAASTIHADVVVVGAGPAGLAAACRAAEAGASVVMLDEAPAPGGQVWRRPVGADGAGGAEHAATRLARAWSQRFAASGARFLARATVIDALPGATALGPPPDSAAGATSPGATLLVDHGGRGLRVEARRLVIATGARERFLPFPGWTLPNAVGVGGAQALLKSGAAVRGKRVVIAGSGPLLLPVAAAFARAGARIALVAEQAPASAVARFAAGLWRHPHLLAQAVRYRAAFWRAPYRCGTWVSAACGDGSTPEVREATLTDGLRSWRERCDLLACAYGLVPNLRLARLLGCATAGSGSRRVVRVDGLQQTSIAGIYCAGEPTGIGGLELALLTGQIAGIVAAKAARAAGAAAASRAAGAAPPARELASLQRRRDRRRAYSAALGRAFQPRPELLELPAPETLVCRCEDVPLGKLDPAWSPRQAKLYTRAGMGPCQGRVCGPALELLRGWDEPDTVRAPLEPAPLAILASLGAEEASTAGGGGGTDASR